MAEVKQVSGSFSLSSSSKKKPPSFSNNGVSSSFKHVYDDVFGSSPSRNLQSSVSFMEDDYAEVFSCSKSNNGCWSIPYSSIPIIDLPKDNGVFSRGERVDYGGVFGGIDSDCFGLPDGEELFDQLKKKAKTSSSHTLPRCQEQAMEATSPGISNQSNGQLPRNEFSQLFDSMKNFDPRKNELTGNAASRSKKSAHVPANSLHEVSTTQKTLSSQTSVIKDDGKSPANVLFQSSNNMKHFEPNSEMAMGATSGPRKASHVRAYSLHEASATLKTFSSGSPVINEDRQSPANGFCQSPDKTRHLEPGNSERTVNGTSMPRNSSHVRAYSLHEASTPKSFSSEKPVIKDDGLSPMNGFCQSFENAKHFEHESNGMAVNTSFGPRKTAAHVRAFSLHENTLSSQMPVMKDDTLDADSNFGEKQGKYSKHTSLGLNSNKQNSNDDAGLQTFTGMSGSNLVNSSPGTSQTSKAAMNEHCQSFDSKTHSKYKTNEMSINRINEATQAADIHAIHESNDALPEISPPQKTFSSNTSVLNDVTPPATDDKLVEEKRKHSHNASLDLGTNRQNGVCVASFHKESGLHESTSIDSSQEVFQTSFGAGPSKVVNGDAEVATSSNKIKKKGRHSRMNSLDLSDYNNSCGNDVGLQRKPRFGNSYSFDASHDPCAAQVKMQPSKMYPSSSLPQFFSVESHYKISENPNYKSSQKNMCGEVGSPPSLAEEFDVNSAAAISAAALQRAIEEAEIRIRLAKEFLERERKGCTNLRFKDTLKVKVKVKRTVAKENGPINDINRFKQTTLDDSFPPEDSDMQPFSPSEELEQERNATNAQKAARLEDQSKFVKDREFSERRDTEVLELDREEDKCEGGEWEAAKHLNQIISGVKNRIASFMSWQSETEKKENLKENETKIPQQQPEEDKHDLKDHEVYEERKPAKNQSATTSSGDAMHGENRVQIAPEAVEAEENKSIRDFTAKLEKVGNKVGFTPNNAEPSLATFQFFAFRNQTLFERLDPEVEEKKGHQESRELETENEQLQVIKEAEDEHLRCQGDVVSPEELDSKCVAQDYSTQNDLHVTGDIGSSDGENDRSVEVPSSLPGHSEMELSHEGDKCGDMNRKGNVCSTNDEIAEMVEGLFSMAVHDRKELAYEEAQEGDMNRKGDECPINDEVTEMVEDLFFVIGHDIKELAHEVDMQDDMTRKNHIGFINEENVEIVEEPCSLAGHDEKVFTDEDDRHNDSCRKGDLSSNSEEGDKIVDELYIHTRHEQTNVLCEENNEKCLDEECEEELLDHSGYNESATVKTEKDGEYEVQKEAVKQHENVNIVEEMNMVEETSESLEITESVFGFQENERDELKTNHIEEASGQAYGYDETKPIETETVDDTEEIVTVEEGFKQNESLSRKTEEASRFIESSSKVENVVNPCKESTSEPELDIDLPVSAQKASVLRREESVPSPLSTESLMKVDRDGIKEGLNDNIGTLQGENFVSLDSDTDMPSGEKDVDVEVVETQTHDNSEDETDYWHESHENLHGEEFGKATEQNIETSGAEAVHKRRRWFDHKGSIASSGRPSILEDNQTDLEIEQEVLNETELTGSVEIHAGKLDCSTEEVAIAKEAEGSFNQDNSKTNVEVTPKRRRWFVKRGEEGVPEPLSLFEGVKANLEVPLENTDEMIPHKDTVSGNCLDSLNTISGESLNAVKSDVTINGEKDKQSGEAAPRRKRWFESRERVGLGQQVRGDGDVGLTVETDQEPKAKEIAEISGKHGSMPIPQEDGVNNTAETKEHNCDMVEVKRREKEKEKEKLAVERAIREARERAFAEARERAKRDAAERPHVEARKKVTGEAQEKLGKVSSDGTSSSDKASVEAKLKAERAAVERATSEARERALQKTLSEKSLHRSREQESKYQNTRCSDASSNSEKFEGVDVESTQRRKARLERQKRTTERAAKALEEKNKSDLVAQKEQAAKNVLADALDAEVRRWSTGKEGNLRALLSTLQYILGPDSGWQPVSLTDLVAATAVRKAYKKATLCVHPDKLQQRGASIQQKHICEKVFDLLKEAWSKFNPDER